MPTRNAPTAADDLHLRREAGDEEREPEHRQQQHLGALGPHELRDERAVTQRDVEDDEHHGERDHDADRRRRRGPTPISSAVRTGR